MNPALLELESQLELVLKRHLTAEERKALSGELFRQSTPDQLEYLETLLLIEVAESHKSDLDIRKVIWRISKRLVRSLERRKSISDSDIASLRSRESPPENEILLADLIASLSDQERAIVQAILDEIPMKTLAQTIGSRLLRTTLQELRKKLSILMTGD